mmetsp:Transcript_2048/g.3619  ORF Transcript_2048/g.3619 Transcript_2048/m.3619 type:complete len:243 (+) Transcript_2048:1548-2276(+)
MRVSVCRLDFKHSSRNLENGNIKRSAAQIIHSDHFSVRSLHSVRKCSSGGLVDNAHHVQSGNASSIFGCLSLCIVEVRGNSDHCVCDCLSKKRFGGFFHFCQHKRSNLARRVPLSCSFHPRIAIVSAHDLERHVFDVSLRLLIVVTASNKSLDCKQSVFGVCDCLASCCDTDESFSVGRERDDRRRGTQTFFTFNDSRIGSGHYSNTRVGCSQINADHWTSWLRRRAQRAAPCSAMDRCHHC